jgi:hypothetical protein
MAAIGAILIRVGIISTLICIPRAAIATILVAIVIEVVVPRSTVMIVVLRIVLTLPLGIPAVSLIFPRLTDLALVEAVVVVVSAVVISVVICLFHVSSLIDTTLIPKMLSIDSLQVVTLAWRRGVRTAWRSRVKTAGRRRLITGRAIVWVVAWRWRATCALVVARRITILRRAA